MTPELKRTMAVLKRCQWNQVHAAAELDVNRSTLKDRVRKLRVAGHSVPVFTRGRATESVVDELKAERAKVAKLDADLKAARAASPVSPPKPRRRAREREDRVVVVFPDVHGSSADPQAVAAFLGDVKALQPDMVVGLGDLVDCGGFLAQHHVLGFVAETAYTYEDDLKAAGAFLDAVRDAAPNAELRAIEGNHDARPERWAVTAALRQKVTAEWLRQRVAPDEVLCFKDRGIQYYRRAVTYDNAPVQGMFRIGKLGFAHGLLNGNSDPGSVLNRFGHSMVYGHTHQMASKVRPWNGSAIGAWNIGTLAKLQPLYAHSSPTLWTHGYGVFVFSKTGNFQAIPVTIVNGVSLLPELKLR
jgi:predicted phosphodiesterase